eukprot:scaffold3194_cov118-Skeletonema_dohrnii-CCMP3373.AAC.5
MELVEGAHCRQWTQYTYICISELALFKSLQLVAVEVFFVSVSQPQQCVFPFFYLLPRHPRLSKARKAPQGFHFDLRDNAERSAIGKASNQKKGTSTKY